MSEVALINRLESTIWNELEAEADNTGGYTDRSTGTIEGRFNIRAIAVELVERFGLVAEL